MSNKDSSHDPGTPGPEWLDKLRQGQANGDDPAGIFESSSEIAKEAVPHQTPRQDITVQESSSHQHAPNPDSMESNQSVSDGLPPEVRRALVSLLRQGIVLASQKSIVFNTICRHRDSIDNHLADMYLKLSLDERNGVAFVAQQDMEIHENGEEEEVVSLISRRTLPLYDTLLLLVLRKHYQERQTAGEQRVMIDFERIEGNLSPFLSLTNSEKSDQRKLRAAVQKMMERRILGKVRGNDDRYEITPIIRYVVGAAFLEETLKEYERLAHETGVQLRAQSDGE